MLFGFFTCELPVSRLQRDLSNSTVIRKIGEAFGHMLIGIKSLIQGLKSLEENRDIIKRDLENHWDIVTEGIQTLLRKYGYPKPYETLKNLARGKRITRPILVEFINNLDLTESQKYELNNINPFNYQPKKIE